MTSTSSSLATSLASPSTAASSCPPTPSSSNSTSLLSSGFVQLPKKLPRPAQCLATVDPTTLELDDELQTVSLDYIVDSLRQLGNDLLLATAHCQIAVPPAVESGAEPLPSHLPIHIPPGTALNPSHILAVHGQDEADVLLLPAHGLAYALACAALPHLSRSRPASDGSGRFPVIHLHVPSTRSFPLLAAYLTSHSRSQLLSSLLPGCVRDTNDGTLSSPASLAQRLASACSQEDLGTCIHEIHGLWADACVLGVGNEDLWSTLQFAWGITIGALAMRSLKLQGQSSPVEVKVEDTLSPLPAGA